MHRLDKVDKWHFGSEEELRRWEQSYLKIYVVNWQYLVGKLSTVAVDTYLLNVITPDVQERTKLLD